MENEIQTDTQKSKKKNKKEPIVSEGPSTIGLYLKSCREKKGLSLTGISQETKISHKILENLENDDLKNLPNKAYVIGFTKTYAKILSLDINMCLEKLNQTYAQFHPQQAENQDLGPKSQEHHEEGLTKTQISPIVYKIAGIGIVGIILFFFFYSIGKNKSTELKKKAKEITSVELTAKTPLLQEEEKLVKELSNIETKKNEEVIVKKEEVKEVIVKKEETKEVVAKTEEVKEVIVKKEEVKEIVEKEINADLKNFRKVTYQLYSINNKMSNEEVNEFIPEKYRTAVIEGKQNLFINPVTDDTWITYKADNEQIKKFILRKGRPIMIRGEVIRIFFGNVNATKVFLNGKPIKIDSRTGVKSLIFPQEKKANFVLPLFVYKDDGSVITSEKYIDLHKEDEKKPYVIQ